MGGLFGKPNVVAVNEVNSVINESILKLASTTSTNNNFTQYIEAGEGSVVSGNTQYIDVKTNTTSIVNASQDSEFDTKISDSVYQDLSKKSVAFLGALDGLFQNNNVKMETKIKNTVNNLNLTELTPVCANNNTITQGIVAKRGSTVTNNSQAVKADFIQSCTANVENNMKSMSDIVNSVNQKASIVSENPFNFLADIAKSWMTTLLLVMVAIIAGVVVLIGPGKVDANALIKQGMLMTPQGRAMAVTQAITPPIG